MIKTDKGYIQLCFDLAKKSMGQTSPNPYVGAVIVKDNQIISTGYHSFSGGDHAELDAIKKANTSLKGATLYCNLEPCCHLKKKTPPCAQRIIEEGIKKVVISNLDPNPKVAGNGVKLLRDNNIEVLTGILEEEGKLLNEVFFTHITKKRPFIHLKWAQTLDGKIATLSNSSKWITNSDSRLNSHKERALYDGVVVGEKTINADDPTLSIRVNEEYVTKRIILSPKLELNPNSKVFNDQFKDKTLIISGIENQDKFNDVNVSYCPLNQEGFDLNYLLSSLYDQGIYSLYIEGGMHTISKFIDQNLYDRISIYMAPKLLGPGIELNIQTKENMSEAISFDNGFFTHINNNILFESKRNICLQD